MRNIITSLALTLSLLMPVAAMATDDANRLELNQATVEQIVATGAVDQAVAQKIVDLRDQLGSFQDYEDLEDLDISPEALEKLRSATSIQPVEADCNC